MISFCCPSRGRPELAKRLVDTATATQKYDTEFLFYLNDDDETLEQYKDLLDAYLYLSKNGITKMVDTTESMYNFNKLKTHVIKGEENNLKITYMSDLNACESMDK